MRPRHEIRETWIMSDDDNQTGVLLEVLLDIRDLLQQLQPPTYTIAQPEVKTDDKGLHRKD